MENKYTSSTTSNETEVKTELEFLEDEIKSTEEYYRILDIQLYDQLPLRKKVVREIGLLHNEFAPLIYTVLGVFLTSLVLDIPMMSIVYSALEKVSYLLETITESLF